MPHKFDEYLAKGGYTNQDREALKGEKAQQVDKPQSPTPVVTDPSKANSTPGKLDEKTAERIESTQQGQGNNHEQQSTPEAPEQGKESMEDKYPSSQSRGEDNAPQQEQDKEQER